MRILWWIGILFGLCLAVLYSYQWVYLFLPRVRKLFFRQRSSAAIEQASEPSSPHIAVCIAARNEEMVLPHLLDSIHSQTMPADIFVIADNCTDGTAEAAKLHGAVVYERADRCKVGKGYALAALWDHMRADGLYERYDAFLIIDADNLLERDYIAEMAKTLSEGYGIVTGFRNTKNFADNWISSGYGLWFLHESVHLNGSRSLLGTSAAVSGTGFCVRRTVLDERGGWIYHTLTEDLEFWTDTVIRGERVGYCPRAVLYDEQPDVFADSIRQRVRWVKGGIQVSLRYGARLLSAVFAPGRSWRERYAALECATLSLWGYGTSAAVSLFGTITGILYSPFSRTMPFWAIGGAALGYILSTLLTAVLTVYESRGRIRATRAEITRAVLTYPLFVATFAIPVVLAFFQKPDWKPIPHRRAVGITEI